MDDPSQRIEVLVTLDEDSGQDIEALSRRLAGKGLENAENLASIGMISGTVAPDKVSQLRAEPGVKAVEIAGRMGIAPPDATIQ